MPVRTSYDPGTPCWADLSSPDIDQAIAFYGGLFGWSDFRVPEAEAGGYTMLRQGDHDVAAVWSAQEPGHPPMWNTYIATDDADAGAERIRTAGGTVLREPFDVMEAGRMAVAKDPGGAVFALWQKGLHSGAGLVNEPISLTWNELSTRDSAAAADFYSAVFGWESELLGADDADAPFVYRMQKLGGNPIAGIMETGSEAGETPPNWMVYFAVADTDATTARANDLGGSLLHGPLDTPYGRMAALADPAGAAFSVVQLTPR